jgi:hypothetical protein
VEAAARIERQVVGELAAGPRQLEDASVRPHYVELGTYQARWQAEQLRLMRDVLGRRTPQVE